MFLKFFTKYSKCTAYCQKEKCRLHINAIFFKTSVHSKVREKSGKYFSRKTQQRQENISHIGISKRNTKQHSVSISSH